MPVTSSSFLGLAAARALVPGRAMGQGVVAAGAMLPALDADGLPQRTHPLILTVIVLAPQIGGIDRPRAARGLGELRAGRR